MTGPGSSRRYRYSRTTGRAAVVLDTGAVTRGSGSKNEDKERNIRKWFVDHDLIEGVILLPDNLFYNTTAAGVIVVLNKRKPAVQEGQDHRWSTRASGSPRASPRTTSPTTTSSNSRSSTTPGDPVEGEVAVIDLGRLLTLTTTSARAGGWQQSSYRPRSRSTTWSLGNRAARAETGDDQSAVLPHAARSLIEWTWTRRH